MILIRVVSAARNDAGTIRSCWRKPSNSIADLHRVTSGLNVNVGGAPFDRSRNDLIDKPDDRRLVGDVPQTLDVEFAAISACDGGSLLFVRMHLSARIVIERPQGALYVGGSK